MGTKENPGAYDCYASLKPDEPYFLLKGSDTLAAPLVAMWAAVREGKTHSMEFYDALNNLKEAGKTKGPHNPDKVLEAKVTALTMRRYSCTHDAVSTASIRDAQHGYRPGYCRKCGEDMTVDSSG